MYCMNQIEQAVLCSLSCFLCVLLIPNKEAHEIVLVLVMALSLTLWVD